MKYDMMARWNTRERASLKGLVFKCVKKISAFSSLSQGYRCKQDVIKAGYIGSQKYIQKEEYVGESASGMIIISRESFTVWQRKIYIEPAALAAPGFPYRMPGFHFPLR
jgi:hypothetical protein